MQAAELGQTLREARESQQISIDDVSRALSLRVAVIEALESGDYSEIGALLYAKNHLRKYVKFLGLDRSEYETIIENLHDSNDPFAQGILKSSQVKREAEDKKKNLTLKYYVGFVILVIAGIAFLIQSGVIPINLSPQFKDNWGAREEGSPSVLEERLPPLEFEQQSSQTAQKSLDELLKDHPEAKEGEKRAQPYYLEEEALESLARAEKNLGDHEAIVKDKSIQKVTTNFETLGGATRYYAALIDQASLPKIDLSHNRNAPSLLLADQHPLYLYLGSKRERLGPGGTQELNATLAKESQESFSIYDQPLGFFEFLGRTLISGKRIDEERFQRQMAEEEAEFRAEIEEALSLEKITEEQFSEELTLFLEKRDALLEARQESQEEIDFSPVEFRFSASDLTTLEIIDAKGDILTSRILRGGEEYRLQALGSFDVQLGNPHAIEKISADGVEIPAYRYKPATEGVTIMRFSLNSEEYR